MALLFSILFGFFSLFEAFLSKALWL